MKREPASSYGRYYDVLWNRIPRSSCDILFSLLAWTRVTEMWTVWQYESYGFNKTNKLRAMLTILNVFKSHLDGPRWDSGKCKLPKREYFSENYDLGARTLKETEKINRNYRPIDSKKWKTAKASLRVRLPTVVDKTTVSVAKNVVKLF